MNKQICYPIGSDGIYKTILGASQMLKEKAEEISKDISNVNELNIRIIITPDCVPQLEITKSHNIVFKEEVDYNDTE